MTKDILILGGGPSGLSTALHIARLAPELVSRILILEKARYPRPKLCAGGLTGDAEILLQRLGLDTSEVPHVDASTAHLDFAGKGLTIALPKTHALRIIRRDEFDAWLAKKAREKGIEIHEGVTVKDVRAREEGVAVETDTGTFRAQIVVGADGSNGVTRRSVLPDAPVHTARVLEVITPSLPPQNFAKHSRRPSRPGGLTARMEGQNLGEVPRQGRWGSGGRQGVAYFDFFPVPDGIAGYVWDFPTQVQGQPMRCWGIYDTNLLAATGRPQLTEPLAEEMARHGFKLDEYGLKGHPIRWFSPFNQFSVPRVILVGDAAGADGIFGEGISVALGYGAIAAKAIRDAFAHQDFSFRDYQRRILLSPLGQTLTVRTAITYILYHSHWRWFQKFFWRIFKPFVAAASWVLVLNWGRRMR
jgi:flavin-dependent dehydrogenase